MSTSEVNSIRLAVREALGSGGPWLLAVSGGLDSMCLLDAAAASLPASRLAVATFDHATGTHSSDAVRFVKQRAHALGLHVTTGRADRSARTEAEWRAMRWQFLRHTASSLAATVVTAHTRDDQVETVLMRVLRDAGARGLAGLLADAQGAPIVRPLLGITRAALERYAAETAIAWIEDPTNASPAHLRNRIRNDLLPALRAAKPGIAQELLEVSERAARWRRDVEAAVEAWIAPSLRVENGWLDVDSSALTGYSPLALGTLWPAIAARAGLTLDRRGTRRLVAFTKAGRVGSRVQVSGGWEMVRERHRFELRRVGASVPEPIELEGNARWGRWSFRRVEDARPANVWSARLPSDRRIIVRRWMPGDRMVPASGRTPRKVKRLLSSAGITGHERSIWPVVLAGDEIVWIPGVRRSDAATDRSGRPVLSYRCEFDHR